MVANISGLEVEGRILLVAARERRRQADQVWVGQHAYSIQRTTPSSLAALRDMIGTHKTDVLIIELETAQTFGVEGCAALKSTTDSPPLLIIGLNPPRTAEAEQAALALGADDILDLPWRPSESLPRLLSLLRLRRQAETLRKENQQLRQSLVEHDLRLKVALTTSREYSLLRDSIVHNAVHEMGTPLLQVKSSVSMLDGAVRTAFEDNNLEVMLDFAKQALTRLENVLENFRHLARSLDIRAEPIRLEESLSLALRALSRRWASTDKMHRVKVQHGDLPAVLGDKQAIAQVLQQLIDNALKFSAEDQMVEVIAQPTANGVQIAVCDHGIGMEADQIGRIFKEFYQTESGTRRRFEGVGIGLAIVKLILDRLDVPIQVESQPNQGSTFSFSLKAAPLN
ncbi:MAG: sensor histidine kinase [Chloroflexi bacterium CFX4]|nr:sensor histidine kinase [Chloroflexi bacterium CFX4]MDL1923469.1 HAMP domain-containing histidine kinase [Chloroflexi bacterium CFX3]